MSTLRRLGVLVLGAALLSTTLAACSSAESNEDSMSLTVYSGRAEEYVAEFFAQFEKESGITLSVRYGDSAELAAQILEEGKNTPADLFFSQDAGSLGAVSDLFQTLPSSITGQVNSRFVSPDDKWVGITGRARVFAYAPDRVTALPTSIDDMTNPKYKGRLGIAPTNSSFQAFVTAMRNIRGEAATEQWLRAVAKNAVIYPKNSAIVEAIDAGTIDIGLVNHYYVSEVAESLGRDINVKVGFFKAGDPGNLINLAGAGVFATAKNKANAEKLIAFLTAAEQQANFVARLSEYPVADGVDAPGDLPALTEIGAPKVDFAVLKDLAGTQALLTKVGLI
jgi:iron(III) transport system substrate-binding protein